MSYTVLLYYKFIKISDAQALWQAQRQLCQRLNLKGRILVGEEGINGTVAGTRENIQNYKEAIWQDPNFANLIFKESQAESNPFPKLKVKLRPEIISLHVGRVNMDDKGSYISPDELHSLLETGEEIYLLDTRNRYESEIGAFTGAITPEIDNFRELPAAVSRYPELKDKKVVTYCTGGIRCEKATAYLKQQGFRDVYQLEGGIVSYILKYPNAHFQGECYIFDDRMQVSQSELAKTGAISQAPLFPEQSR